MGDNDGATPPAPSNDRRDVSGKTCEHCGSTIETSDWYPITKERSSDGTLHFYPFCSEDCQAAWRDQRPE